MKAAQLNDEEIDIEQLVRLTNSLTRLRIELGKRADEKRPKRPYGLADIQAALAEGRDDEDEVMMKPLNQTTIIEACREPKLFAPLFQSGWFKKTDDSWKPWFAFLKALFGLPLDEAELEIFKQCTGLDTPPDGGVFEAALICGRRSGKSRTMALIATYLATMVDWSPYLAKGERGTVVVVATDKKQARSIFNGVREFLKVKLLSPLIQRETLESLELSNGITIEILPASYRTIRGYTVVAALLDELAFWRTDEGSSNPDREIVNAVRPAMATVPASRLILASSPYGKRSNCGTSTSATTASPATSWYGRRRRR